MAAYDAVLDDQFVGGFLVDGGGELIHSFGIAHRWLRHPPGRVTTRLVELIENPELRALLSAALEATGRGDALERSRIALPDDGGPAQLIARPLAAGDRALSLVFFRPEALAIDATGYRRLAELFVSWTDEVSSGVEVPGAESSIHPADVDALRDEWSAVQRSGEGFYARARRWSPEHRGFRWCDHYGAPTSAGAWLICGIDVHQEVTESELLRAENARLRQSMRERTADLESNLANLAERNTELDRFAHVAAHDLKAPVRAVLSFSEAVAEELEADHPAVAYLERIQAAADRMGKLVESLLRFAASARGELRIEDVDLEECLDAVRLDLRAVIEESNAEVVNTSLPTVQADATAIRQLLQNLVANGLKFVDGVSPRVVVSAESRDGDFEIRVEDNGVGFDPAYASEIFEPFRRLHSTRRFRGSGVGLSICRRIIQRHGGAIWAHSEPGKGARFHFTLPRQPC